MNKSTLKKMTRREWLGHCTALGLGAAAWLATAVHAQEVKPSLKHVILVVGDSLSAEYGLPRGTGWVALLQRRLTHEHIDATVINASISGDTTAGGLTRVAGLLEKHQPHVVVFELGGNDALRGLPLAKTRDNLSAMTRAAKAVGAKVLLLGMQIPPNYGHRYSKEFADIFTSVAHTEGTALVPFLLEGVSRVQFQADSIHPAEGAQKVMLANVWDELKPLLR